ncbi:MAG: hypothetical protein ACJAYC_003321 [Halieaceae bacterium]|jgi:hypothetical protein
MAEATTERARLLRQEYLSQTARIPWRDLQTYYAAGSVVRVDPELDLIETAVQLGLDDAVSFEQWINSGKVAPVDDQQALAWFKSEIVLWAVVAAPWILVQERAEV